MADKCGIKKKLSFNEMMKEEGLKKIGKMFLKPKKKESEEK